MGASAAGETWAALGYLAVVGSVLVFLLYLMVSDIGPRRVQRTGPC